MKDDIYQKLVARNAGYVSSELQKKIRATTVLIAGCGVGSTIAEAAVRMGFENFILADGDTVEAHNLNRQAYAWRDVGRSKASALRDRLRAIHPAANVQTHERMIESSNVADLVRRSDLVFDTIDFLDLPGITALHDECHKQKKPIISAVSAGWGAAAVFFPPATADHSLFREMFGLPLHGSVDGASYVEHFGPFLRTLSERLDPAIVEAMAKSLMRMEDGTPCPAPHVSPGSYSVAALALTLAAKYLESATLVSAPDIILVNLLEPIRASSAQSTNRLAQRSSA